MFSFIDHYWMRYVGDHWRRIRAHHYGETKNSYQWCALAPVISYASAAATHPWSIPNRWTYSIPSVESVPPVCSLQTMWHRTRQSSSQSNIHRMRFPPSDAHTKEELHRCQARLFGLGDRTISVHAPVYCALIHIHSVLIRVPRRSHCAQQVA